jgi:hypothetical protein
MSMELIWLVMIIMSSARANRIGILILFRSKQSLDVSLIFIQYEVGNAGNDYWR